MTDKPEGTGEPSSLPEEPAVTSHAEATNNVAEGDSDNDSSGTDDVVEQDSPPSWLTRSWRTVRSPFESLAAKYALEEELSWKGEPDATRNLFLTLRVRYELSREASVRDGTLGLVFSGIGILAIGLAVFVAFIGWSHAIKVATAPSGFPLATLSTSATVLLILGAAALVLRLAERFSERSATNLTEANHTRRLQAAVRLAAMAGTQSNDAGRRLARIANKLVTDLPTRTPSPDISAIPEILHAVLEIAKTVKSGKTE